MSLDVLDNEIQVQVRESTTATGLSSVCPGWFTHGHCEHGHNFVKVVYCGREWCPICGKKDSIVHNRRIARLLPKMRKIESAGYFVFTIPEALRDEYRDKKTLGGLMKLATSGDKQRKIPGLLESFGFSRGIARWHFFGDFSRKYHPHLNVIVDGRYIRKSTLREIKRAWAALLGYDGPVVVNYEYRPTPAQMFHTLRYVTRATFRNYKWAPKLAGSLYRFRNIRTWGTWDDDTKWDIEQGETDFYTIFQMEKGRCPFCQGKVEWTPVTRIEHMKRLEKRLVPLVEGYFTVIDP